MSNNNIDSVPILGDLNAPQFQQFRIPQARGRQNQQRDDQNIADRSRSFNQGRNAQLNRSAPQIRSNRSSQRASRRQSQNQSLRNIAAQPVLPLLNESAISSENASNMDNDQEEAAVYRQAAQYLLGEIGNNNQQQQIAQDYAIPARPVANPQPNQPQGLYQQEFGVEVASKLLSQFILNKIQDPNLRNSASLQATRYYPQRAREIQAASFQAYILDNVRDGELQDKLIVIADSLGDIIDDVCYKTKNANGTLSKTKMAPNKIVINGNPVRRAARRLAKLTKSYVSLSNTNEQNYTQQRITDRATKNRINNAGNPKIVLKKIMNIYKKYRTFDPNLVDQQLRQSLQAGSGRSQDYISSVVQNSLRDVSNYSQDRYAQYLQNKIANQGMQNNRGGVIVNPNNYSVLR